MGDVGRLVAAVLANDRGFYSAVGSTDAEKVETLERALDLLPSGPPGPGAGPGHLVLGTYPRQPARATAGSGRGGHRHRRVLRRRCRRGPGPQPSSRPAPGARPVRAAPRPGPPKRLVRAERIGDPVLLFWAARWRLEAAARAGDIDEMDRCLAIHGAMAAATEPARSSHWGHTFVRSLRAQIAGDTDRAEQCATEALQIGTEGGQLDAAVIFGAQLNDRVRPTGDP